MKKGDGFVIIADFKVFYLIDIMIFTVIKIFRIIV